MQRTTSGDFRTLPRVFAEASRGIADNEHFRRLCRFVVREICSIESGIKQMTITLHQVTTVATPGKPLSLPDGIHQDGADYIVSAIPIILSNVELSVSTVYDLAGITVNGSNSS